MFKASKISDCSIKSYSIILVLI